METAIKKYATLQGGSTCWFHSILNGFILGKVGRVYLKRALANFKRQLTATARREFETNSTNNSGRCPRSLVDSRSFFKKLQNSLFRGTGDAYSFTNVRNLVRGGVTNNAQDQYLRIVDFMKAIGMDEYTNYYSDGVLRVPATSGNAYIHIDTHAPTRNLEIAFIRNRQRKYSFVTIQLKSANSPGDHSTHLITGVYDDFGYEYIVDSNGFAKKCEFNKILTDPDYSAWCVRAYGSRFTELYFGLRVYIERDALPLRNVFSVAGKRERNTNITLRRNKTNNRAIKRRRVN
jgi:hypothetical protein